MKVKGDIVGRIVRSADPNRVTIITTGELLGTDKPFSKEATASAIYELARKIRSDTGFRVLLNAEKEEWIITIGVEEELALQQDCAGSQITIVPKEREMTVDRGRGKSERDGPNGSLSQDLAIIRSKQSLNVLAFERLLPELLKTDPDKFVAFFDGKIVGKDADQSELMKRLPKNLVPAAHILIRQVVENQEPDVLIVNRPLSGEQE